MSTATKTTADVVIIGGGLEGTATAWALARRGVRNVVVAERSTVGAGGTGKSSGVVRCHYGVSSLAKMANKALEVFENAQEILGTDVGFHQTGYVVGVGESNVGALRASLEDQRKVGVDTQEIGQAEVAKLWPVANLDDFAAFAWEPRGGYGDAYQTAQAFAAAARRDGVRILQGTRVTEIRTAGDQVTGVRLADGTAISAPTVIVAAGPWSVALLEARGIHVPITVHREQVVLVDPGTRLGPVPVFSDLVSLQYVRPEASGQILFGNSDLATLHPADPDSYVNRADADFLEVAVDKMAHRFPGLTLASIASSYAGCYDVTPDFNPVISRTPVAGLIVAVGFSGHGFKISPSVGQLIADLVIDGKSSDPDIPESDFRLSRFEEGELLRSPHPYDGAGEMRLCPVGGLMSDRPISERAAHGPAVREVDEPAPRHGRLERAIAEQVRRLRHDRGLTLAEMAARTGISVPMLSKIENASISCSLTTLERLADSFDVPVTSLFRGADTQREAVYTPAGAGARIVARGTRVGHDYTLLGALRGPHKRMEAHIVTLTERSEEFPLFQHPGTELLYMLEGEMVYGHGDASYRMVPGDALQLDGEGTHGPRELVALPIRFLSVVAYGEVGLLSSGGQPSSMGGSSPPSPLAPVPPDAMLGSPADDRRHGPFWRQRVLIVDETKPPATGSLRAASLKTRCC